MNSTIEKFGFPASLVREFQHWLVLARPAQVTLGSLVLAARSDATAFSDLTPEAFSELKQVIVAIEGALASFVQFERINYLMLMMVDPHVHFHVIPRYSEARSWGGITFADAGWPGPPRLEAAVIVDPGQLSALAKDIAVQFRSATNS